MADAAITGGVEAGRGASDGVRRSFTRVFGSSPSSSIFEETEWGCGGGGGQKPTDQSDSPARAPTFRLLVVMMTSPVRLVVRPCADGKLRRGGGGGGDLEGFSVRYLATLRSTENREEGSERVKGQQSRADSPDPRWERAPSMLFSFWAASCTLPSCWSAEVVLVVLVEAAGPGLPVAGEEVMVEAIGMVIWGLGGTAGLLICLAAKSRSGMAFISSAWVSSSSRLMS